VDVGIGALEHRHGVSPLPQPIRRATERATIADDLRFITSPGTRLMAEPKAIRYPTVHLRGGSAIRRPLIVLAVCAVAAVGYVARDFLIPTAGAVVLALMLTPVANTLERIRLPVSVAAATSVLLLTLLIAGLLAVAIPSISNWAEQAPFLTLTLERKLEGLRKSLAFMQEVTNRVEQAASAAPTTPHPAQATTEKVVVTQHSLLGMLASTTPVVVLQLGYAGVLAFMLLAHRNTHRRQLLRIPVSFETRVRLARTLRDINERVGHYLFSLAVIYVCVAVLAAIALTLLDFPNPMVWGAVMGIASFVPFVGPPIVIGLVAVVGMITYDDWYRIVAAPAALLIIHFIESQLVTPAFVSRRCALNTVAVFASIALLGWMWGAIGAIVAVPLLILLSTIAANMPSLRWLEIMLADDRPVSERIAVKPPLASVRGRPSASPKTRQPRRRLVAAK
jgi:predicted PurR-regulated permease PerM